MTLYNILLVFFHFKLYPLNTRWSQVTQRFIFSFEIAHENQAWLKICHHFSFTSNKSITQNTILFPLSTTGSLMTKKLSLEQQMLRTWDKRWNILLPTLNNICKNQVSRIFQYLVVFKWLKNFSELFIVKSSNQIL